MEDRISDVVCQRQGALNNLGILQGTGRLQQMQVPHTEAMHVRIDFGEAADRAADSPAFLEIIRPRTLRARKGNDAGFHDRPTLRVYLGASSEINAKPLSPDPSRDRCARA